MTGQPLHVAFISHSGQLGGAEICLVELVEGLTGLYGVRADVVLPRPGPLGARLAAAGGHPQVLRHAGWATAVGSWPACVPMAALNIVAVLRLVASLRRLRPDIVATNSLINPAGAYAARLAGIPHVWLVHEYGDLDHGYRFLLGVGRSLREVGRLSARVMTCSRALARRVSEHVPPDRIEVAHYAVTEGLDRPLAPATCVAGRLRLLVLGRKHPGKGQAEAVRAVGRLRARGVDVRLRAVGQPQGTYALELERLSRSLGLEDRVELVPWVIDPVAEIDACDALLLCSRSEAFGRVVVEAMKRDRPVIVADAGGAPELVAESGGGLLYPPGDDEALACVIERLAADPVEARRLAGAGRAWAQRHCTLQGYARAFLDAANRAQQRTRWVPSASDTSGFRGGPSC